MLVPGFVLSKYPRPVEPNCARGIEVCGIGRSFGRNDRKRLFASMYNRANNSLPSSHLSSDPPRCTATRKQMNHMTELWALPSVALADGEGDRISVGGVEIMFKSPADNDES